MSGRHCISFFYRIGLLVFISSTLVTQAAVLEVREGERIQDAVNAASPGDEILVYPGLYSEPSLQTASGCEINVGMCEI